MEKRSSALLFALVFTLACADWLVAPTTAQPGENQAGGPEAAAPAQVPAVAFLTGGTAQSAMVDGVQVTLEGAPGEGFVLAFHNPATEPQHASFDVECVQVSGLPMGRVGPFPQVVHRERVDALVLAGATVRRRLEADVPAPPTEADEANSFAAFNTTSFQLRRPSVSAAAGQQAEAAQAQPPVLAVLRWSDTPGEAG